MPFIAEWAKNYALEWLKDHMAEVLPEIVKSQREDIATLERKEIPLWPLLSDRLRGRLLEQAQPFAPTILEFDPEEITDVILECLNENGLDLKRDWVKGTVLAFREDLASLA